MSRSLEAMLAYEASRRPEIADLVLRAAFLSDQDIEDAVVPLPWYRKALVLVRDQARAILVAQELEATLPQEAATPREGIMGKVYRYTGGDIWVRLVDSIKAEVEIKHNSMVFVADDGRAWLGESYCDPIDPRILESLQPLGEMLRDDYKRMRNEDLNRNCPANAPVISLGEPEATPSGAASRLAGLGITFR